MDVDPSCPSEGRVTEGLCCWRKVVKAAARVGLLDRSESRVLGSAMFVGFVVLVVVNMGAVLMKGVVMLGGLAAEPAGGVYLNRFFLQQKKNGHSAVPHHFCFLSPVVSRWQRWHPSVATNQKLDALGGKWRCC